MSEVLPGVSRSATGSPRMPRIAWILVVRPPRETPIAGAFVRPFPMRRAVRLQVGAVQVADLVDRTLLRQRRQQALEHAAAST